MLDSNKLKRPILFHFSLMDINGIEAGAYGKIPVRAFSLTNKDDDTYIVELELDKKHLDKMVYKSPNTEELDKDKNNGP